MYEGGRCLFISKALLSLCRAFFSSASSVNIGGLSLKSRDMEFEIELGTVIKTVQSWGGRYDPERTEALALKLSLFFTSEMEMVFMQMTK